jgi:glycosyltransferase involved in cell wall biosynthesis
LSSILNSKKPSFKLAVFYQANPEAGGAFTYEKALDRILDEICFEQQITLFRFIPINGKRFRNNPGPLGDDSHKYKVGLSALVQTWALRSHALRRVLDLVGVKVTSIERKLLALDVDLVYFASPNPLALGLRKTPFMTTVWDLGHRDLPEFAEFSSDGRWDEREMYYSETAPSSVAIITDSDDTGFKLAKHYGVSEDRCFSVGLLPEIGTSEYQKGTAIDSPFIYYPANKWMHKNHTTLLKAIAVLRSRGVKIQLVLTGAEMGAGPTITKEIVELDIADLVVDKGFVDNDVVDQLYRTCSVLAMPSLLGPTNLPPLEALLHGKPVVVSDVHCFNGVEGYPVYKAVANSPEDWADKLQLAVAEKPFDPAPLKQTLETAAGKSLRAAIGAAVTRTRKARG